MLNYSAIHTPEKATTNSFIVFPRHPMQRQRWHEKEKYEHDAQLDEKQ
jgi:hypothetical protein